MFVFTDIETTGLDSQLDSILEVAVIVTDNSLWEIGSMVELVSYNNATRAQLFEKANPVVKDMHTVSKLWKDLEKADYTLDEIDEMIVKFLVDCNVEAESTPLAGSSIGSLDRPFIDTWMPRFSGHLSYRNIDVSTIKELCSRWNPSIYDSRPTSEEKPHRAMEDARAAIEELKFYRDNFLFTL